MDLWARAQLCFNELCRARAFVLVSVLFGVGVGLRWSVLVLVQVRLCWFKYLTVRFTVCVGSSASVLVGVGVGRVCVGSMRMRWFDAGRC
eukprot:15436272-Alexandrium_andersonii.AAC.1